MAEKISHLFDEDIVKVLEADKGEGVTITSWELQSLAKQGFTAEVKRVKVNYSKTNEHCEVSYIAKINSKISIKFYENKNRMFYGKEDVFYNKVAPALRGALGRVSRPLRVPRCFLSIIQKDRQITLMEDLNPLNFHIAKKIPGEEVVDLSHALLAFQELASIQASSLVVETDYYKGVIEDKFPVIREKWFEGQPHRGYLEKWWSMQLFIVRDLAATEGSRYKNQMRWLDAVKGRVTDALLEGTKPTHSKFSLLVHNDYHHDNMLFRYDDDGRPTEIMLVDWQMATKASAVIDMIIFLFMCMKRQERNNHWPDLLACYYGTFSSILKEAGHNVPFTATELKDEFLRKVDYGILFCLAICNEHYLTGEDVVPFPKNDNDVGVFPDAMKNATLKVLNHSEKGVKLKDHIFSLLDDLKEFGVV